MPTIASGSFKVVVLGGWLEIAWTRTAASRRFRKSAGRRRDAEPSRARHGVNEDGRKRRQFPWK